MAKANENGLTKHQQAFVDAYLCNSELNATECVRKAGYKTKYPDKIASQLLGKARVREVIQKAMDERAKRTEITADKVIQELAKIGFADIKEFLSFHTRLTKVGQTDDGEDIIDYAAIVELKDSDSVDGTLIQEIKQTKDGISFKLHSKLDALDKIGKHLKLFTDKVEVTGRDGGPIEVDSPRERIASRIAQLTARSGTESDSS